MLSATDLAEGLGFSTPATNVLNKELIRLNILKEISGLQRGRVYDFERYLELSVK